MSEELETPDESEEEAFEELDVSPAERKLVTQPYDLSIRQLAADVAQSKILLIEVPYQRQYVWDDAKASRLIESLLLNVPIPVCYFAENFDGTWEVIDGLQRTQSVVRFLRGEFQLRGLSVAREFNGKSFSDLPARDQRRIETRTVRCVVVTDESHPDIKFDVFERLNTGSVRLTPQELRNCIYRGDLNESLKSVARGQKFLNALGRKSSNTRMADEELVLRYFALTADLGSYKPPVTQFLNEYMRANRGSGFNTLQIAEFEQVMGAVGSVFGDTGFRTRDDRGELRGVNRALFDAVAIAVHFSDLATVVANASMIREGHELLLRDPQFQALIGRATADRVRMIGRVSRYADILKKAGVTVTLPSITD